MQTNLIKSLLISLELSMFRDLTMEHQPFIAHLQHLEWAREMKLSFLPILILLQHGELHIQEQHLYSLIAPLILGKLTLTGLKRR